MADATPRSRQPPSWEDIPRDLAGMVLRLLPACADRARFAAVCPQWRAAARERPLPPPLPLLALPDGTFYSLPHGKPFRFPGFGYAGYKSACGGRWLVLPRDDGCFLVDPFAGATVALPPLSRVRLRPRMRWLSMFSFRGKVCCRRAGETLVAGQSEFEVFKADLEHSQWVNVTTLGDDHMLFLGRPCSRAMSASQYGMPGDQIFFLDDVMENCKQYSYDEETTSVSVYNMRSGEVSFPLPMIWKHEMILATWLFPWD
ncbi:F-box protein [Panicum miliaceum]|uniref:F-box protein n=1 Tax=Panicum miliaceum TaxID=4540 RepID=A0A3L6QPP0_PANMI|nr:F-box protein [Panicum miliaceum]